MNPKVIVNINSVEEDTKPTVLRMSLSILEKANTVYLLYRFEREDILLKMIKKVKVGMVVQLSLGYENKVKSVFFGYIHNLEITQFTQYFELEIYAQDVLGLMMNQHRFIHYKEKSAQHILEDILKDSIYQPFIKSTKIDKQKDVIDTYTQWSVSDFETIKSICEEKNRVFYMRDDRFIVEKMGSEFTPEIVFFNFGLHFIRRIHCAQNMNGRLILQGFDKDFETLEYKQEVNLENGACDASIFKTLAYVKRYETIVDQNTLKTKAQDMSKTIALRASSIHFSCIYVPELQCGRKLNFEAIACIGASCVLSQIDVVFEEDHFLCEAEAMIV